MNVYPSHWKIGTLILLFLSFGGLTPVQAQPSKEDRVVFLGDSITQAGRYIEYLELIYRLENPNVKPNWIPLGLSSETVSGLSEPGHAGGAFPRPDLHERLDRVLEKTNPTLVFACYGMNDGIYHPWSEDRFESFRNGKQLLHDKAIRSGARIVHITPPVFDALPIRQRVLPAGRERYEQPFEGYDEVLGRYSAWLVEQGKKEGWQVIDLHEPMLSEIEKRRKEDPEFTFAKDGVHPNEAGQRFIANVILRSWGYPAIETWEQRSSRFSDALKRIHEKHDLLRFAWLSHVGHKRPGVPKGETLESVTNKVKSLDESIVLP